MDFVHAASKWKHQEEGGEDDSEIRTAMSRSQKQVAITATSQNKCQLCKKKVKLFVKFCECTKQNILDYVLFMICVSSHHQWK
jgi:hypothetical protein